MKKRVTILFVIGLLAFTFALITGCRDKNPDTEAEIASLSFSVTFTNTNTADTLWVFLHTLAGDSVVAVRQVIGNGVADFGYRGTTRVTATVAHRWSQASVELRSYYDVPGGQWIWDVGRMNSNSVGYADITLTFPANSYQGYYLCLPGYTAALSPSSLTTAHWNGNLYELDGEDRFSFYGIVFGDTTTTSYCGCLLNQPLLPGQTDTLALTLNQAMQERTITSSRLLNSLAVSAYQGTKYKDFFSYIPLSGGDYTHFPFKYCSYSAGRYKLNGYYNTGDMFYSIERRVSQVPSSIIVPDGSINATYNATDKQFSNIALTGVADAVIGNWLDPSGNLTDWLVCSSNQSHSLHLPVVPDSLLAILNVNLTNLAGGNIAMVDYDNTNNLDGAINIWFKSTDAEALRFGSEYYYRKTLTASPDKRDDGMRLSHGIHELRPN